MKVAHARRSREVFRSIVDRTPGIVMHEEAPDIGTIAAGKFKATCLQLLDRAEEGESIAITKRGKVVARLVPPEPVTKPAARSIFGLLKGKVKIKGDIVGPDFEAWGMKDPRKR